MNFKSLEESSHVSSYIRIATFNIRNVQDRYPMRCSYLKQTISKQQADIMGIQEVDFDNSDQLNELVDLQSYSILKGYTQLKYHELQKIQTDQWLDGNSLIFTRMIKVLRYQELHLSHVRMAQMTLMQVGSKKFIVVNTHLHHVPEDSEIRLHQLQGLVHWVHKENKDSQLDEIILGDFNFTPRGIEYQFMLDNGYQSSYKMVNKKEPEKTFPTGLQGPYMDRDPPGTFDYIWHKGSSLKPVESQIFGTEELEGVAGIYASDHYGVLTVFE